MIRQELEQAGGPRVPVWEFFQRSMLTRLGYHMVYRWSREKRCREFIAWF